MENLYVDFEESSYWVMEYLKDHSDNSFLFHCKEVEKSLKVENNY